MSSGGLHSFTRAFLYAAASSLGWAAPPPWRCHHLLMVNLACCSFTCTLSTVRSYTFKPTSPALLATVAMISVVLHRRPHVHVLVSLRELVRGMVSLAWTGAPVEELFVYRCVQVHQLLADGRERHTRQGYELQQNYGIWLFGGRLISSRRALNHYRYHTPVACIRPGMHSICDGLSVWPLVYRNLTAQRFSCTFHSLHYQHRIVTWQTFPPSALEELTALHQRQLFCSALDFIPTAHH